MIKRIYKDNYDLLKYVGEDYYKCIHLYLYYKKYEFKNEDIKIYVQ